MAETESKGHLTTVLHLCRQMADPFFFQVPWYLCCYAQMVLEEVVVVTWLKSSTDNRPQSS